MKARAIDLLLYPKLFSGGIAAETSLRGRANSAASRAIAEGQLVRQPCEACGVADRVCDDGRPLILAHHHSYKPEHWLSVIWLCRVCHNRVHAGLIREPRTGHWYIRSFRGKDAAHGVPVHIAANGQMTLPDVPANEAAPRRRRLKSAA